MNLCERICRVLTGCNIMKELYIGRYIDRYVVMRNGGRQAMADATASPDNTLQNVITYLCFKAMTLSQLKLMKLVYLADVYHMERFGSRITDAKFKHWHYGPYSPDVNSEIERLCGIGVIKLEPHQTKAGHRAEVPKPKVKETTVRLSKSAVEVLEEIIEDWGKSSSDEVTKYAKTSLPFVGTEFGKKIDFSRIDIVAEYAKEKGVSLKEAATYLAESNKELMAELDKALERARV